jgi:hypothetical protein
MFKIHRPALIICFLVATLFLFACGTSQDDLDATESQVAEDVVATQTESAPTDTPVPTDTPTQEPTEIPTQVPTDTPAPTDTPPPTVTNTPGPTDTPEPTVPSVPTIGPIMYFPLDFSGKMEEYPRGTTQVYACFEYWNMSPDARLTGYLYFNGKEVANISQVFELEGNDNFCFTIGSQTRQMEHGTWKLSIYLDKDLAQSASYKVLR